jgi:2-C-methyl-D-erythritol 4-phosphate cytidylyltransferase
MTVLETGATPGPADRSTARAVGVVVPVAGGGFSPLAGRPLLDWVLEDLHASSCVGQLVLAAHPDALPDVEKLAAGCSKPTEVVPGGASRREQVVAGVAAMPPRFGYVAVHDACWPLAGGLLDQLVELLAVDQDGIGGVLPGIPVSDTIHEVDGDGRSTGIVDRERLRRLQSPRLFVRAALQEALASGADDSLLPGRVVKVVPGLMENVGILTSLDLAMAELALGRRHDRR